MSLLDRESRNDDCGDNIGIRPFSPEPEYRTIFPPFEDPEKNKTSGTESQPLRPTFRNIVHERDIAQDFHPHTQLSPTAEGGVERIVGENGARLITSHYRSALPSDSKTNSSSASNTKADESNLQPSTNLPTTPGKSPRAENTKISDDRKKERLKTSTKSPLSAPSEAAPVPRDSDKPDRLSSFAVKKGDGDPFDEFREKQQNPRDLLKEGLYRDPLPGKLYTPSNIMGRPVGEAFQQNFPLGHPSLPVHEPEVSRYLNRGHDMNHMDKEERAAYFLRRGSGLSDSRSDAPENAHCSLPSPRTEHLLPPISRHDSVAGSSNTTALPSVSPSPVPPHSGSSVSPSPPPSELKPSGQRCPLTSPEGHDDAMPRSSHGFPLRPVAFHPTAPLAHAGVQSGPSAPAPPRPYDPPPLATRSPYYRDHVQQSHMRTPVDYSHGEPSRPTLRPVGTVSRSPPPPTLRPVGALPASRSISEQSSSTMTLPPPQPPSAHRYYHSPAFAPPPDAYIAPPTFSALSPAMQGPPPPQVTLQPYLPPGSRPKPGAGLAIRTETTSRTKRRNVHTSPRKEAAMYGISRQTSKGKEIALEEYVEDEDDDDPYSTSHYRPSGVEGKPAKPKRKHPCTWEGCDKTFTRSGDVDRHIVHVHQKFLAKEQDHPTRCEICGRVLSRKDSAKRHMMSKACGKRKLKSEQGDGVDEDNEQDLENEQEQPP